MPGDDPSGYELPRASDCAGDHGVSALGASKTVNQADLFSAFRAERNGSLLDQTLPHRSHRYFRMRTPLPMVTDWGTPRTITQSGHFDDRRSIADLVGMCREEGAGNHAGFM